MDGKDWIECTDCKKWNHTDCEVKEGKDKEMREVAAQLNKLIELENQKELEAAEKAKNGEEQSATSNKVDEDENEAPYYCLKCRKQKAAEESKKLKAEQKKKQLLAK